ncbi:MAG: fructosamine kinase family protein, partial [Cyanobium sp. MAG_04]|nr:fructosamine kinase family protein [Cyanobium sp. MAG_04]
MRGRAMQAWVEQQLGCAVVAQAPLGGGCIHQAWRLELADGRSVFAKTNAAAALAMFEAELNGLQQLAHHAPAALVIPEPLAWGVAGDRAVLL